MFHFLQYAPWRLQLWGVNYLSAHENFWRGKPDFPPTRTLIAGIYAKTIPNPGLYGRNSYSNSDPGSDNVLAHSEHWGTLGYEDGWGPYRAGSWSECPNPGSHFCLDQYWPDGNIQFIEDLTD